MITWGMCDFCDKPQMDKKRYGVYLKCPYCGYVNLPIAYNAIKEAEDLRRRYEE